MFCNIIWSAGTAGFSTKNQGGRSKLPPSSHTRCVSPIVITLSGDRNVLVWESKFWSGQLSHGVTAPTELIGASFSSKKGLICSSLGKSSQTWPGPSKDSISRKQWRNSVPLKIWEKKNTNFSLSLQDPMKQTDCSRYLFSIQCNYTSICFQQSFKRVLRE